MLKNLHRPTLLLVAIVISLPTDSLGQIDSVPLQDINQVIKKVQDTYASIDGFTANFHQIYVAQKTRREESGTLYIKRPDKMRWEYETPERKLFISDGKQTFFYVPEDNQVTVRKFSSEDADLALPLLFLLKRGNVKRYFSIAWETAEKKTDEKDYILRLVPKKKHTEIASVILQIDPQNYTIERLIVLDYSNGRAEFILSNFKPHIEIEAAKFTFEIPKNAEVVTD